MKERETIAAVATPPGVGALAIIRVSGPEAFLIVSKTLSNPKKFLIAPFREIALYTIVEPVIRNAIDEVTVIKYQEPRSFTGEQMVEIICHGGKRIVMDIMTVLMDYGAQFAGRGEFTRRALENGKIDLLKAEGIKGMIESIGDTDLRCARKLFAGEETTAIKSWREHLIDILSDIEAEIEFGEEENEHEKKEYGKEKIKRFIKTISDELNKREKIGLLEHGIKIVIAGPANAGKSTLFNTLVGYNRAIVHGEPGTTRDIISEEILIKGHNVTLIDSAGLRETLQPVEIEGLKRAKNVIGEANLVLWVTAADEPIAQNEKNELISIDGKRTLCIINKSDQNIGREKAEYFEKNQRPTISVSLTHNKNVDELIQRIEKEIGEISDKIELPEVLLNRRHEKIGRKIKRECEKAEAEWQRPEVAAVHMKNGLSALDEITGATNSEEILNSVFEHFCIGK